MISPKIFLPLLAFATAVPQMLSAAVYTWDGGNADMSTVNVSGTWSGASNWTSASLPASTGTAILGSVTANRIVTYDNNALNVGTIGSLVLDQQTAGITNTLLLNKSLTVANALTLGATSGTSEIKIQMASTTANVDLTPTGGLTVNSGGLLTFDFGTLTSMPNYYPRVSGNVTLNNGGSLVVNGGTYFTTAGATLAKITGNLTVNAGATLNLKAVGTGTAGRLEVDGNFTANGGTFLGPDVSASQLVMAGATNVIGSVTLDSYFVFTLNSLGNQSLSTATTLNQLYVRGTGVKTVTSTATGATAKQITFRDDTAGSTLELKLGSDLSISSGGTLPTAAQTAAGTVVNRINTNSHTFDLSGAATGWTPNNSSATALVAWEFTGGGTIKAKSFTLSSATSTTLGAGTTLQAVGSTANDLGRSATTALGTIDPTSTFLYSGTGATLTSNRAIGNLTVGLGTSSLLKIVTADLTAAGTVSVATSGTLDLGGFNITGAGLNGALGATVTNSSTAKTLTLSGTDSYTYAGAITGNANLSKTGSGIQTLSGLNSYTGATTITGGTLILNGSLATSAVSVGSGAILAGTGTAGGTVNATGNITGGLTFNNDVTVNTGASAAASAFNGNIINNGTISSAVNVHSGKALSGTGSVTNSVTVLSGGKTSAGNGNNTGVLTLDLTYNSGATANFNVSGSSATSSPTALKSGLSYSQVAVSGTAGAVNLQIGTGTALSQILADGSSNSGVTLELTLSVEDFAKLTSNATNNYQAGQSNTSVDNYFVFTLGEGLVDGRFQTLELTVGGIDYVGTIYYSGTNDRYDGVSNLGDVIVNGQEFAVSYTGDASTNSVTGGNDIVLTAIPEPATWAILVGGIGSLLGIQRMRRRS